MLVLSRKPNERVFIGEDIRITVVMIRGNQVRLGFEASPQVRIAREEVCPPIRRSEGADPLDGAEEGGSCPGGPDGGTRDA